MKVVSRVLVSTLKKKNNNEDLWMLIVFYKKSVVQVLNLEVLIKF